jgi:hypothetical protein
MSRLAVVAGLVALGLAASSGAQARVRTTGSAKEVARAMVTGPLVLRSARWVARPRHGRPAAVVSTALTGFPLAGGSYGVLSTGGAARIDDPNDDESTSSVNGRRRVRGARDVVALRIDVRVRRAGCLTLGLRLLSEEVPEFLGSGYNDGFVAELDRSTWRARRGSRTVRARRNFAFATPGRALTIDEPAPFAPTAAAAQGTTYDGASPLLGASRPVGPGRHRIFLSIFDRPDALYDTAVQLDRLTVEDRAPCARGAAVLGP